MNGLTMGGFYTIHITPEAHCSYASFETNIPCSDYLDLVTRVLDVFQPKVSVWGVRDAQRFSLTFFVHRDMGLEEKSPLRAGVFKAKGGALTYACTGSWEKEKCLCSYAMGNYSLCM